MQELDPLSPSSALQWTMDGHRDRGRIYAVVFHFLQSKQALEAAQNGFKRLNQKIKRLSINIHGLFLRNCELSQCGCSELKMSKRVCEGYPSIDHQVSMRTQGGYGR